MQVLKLSYRDLLAILTIAAILAAWWADHQRLLRINDTLQRKHIFLAVDAMVVRDGAEVTQRRLWALFQKHEPERIGTNFEFSVDSDE